MTQTKSPQEIDWKNASWQEGCAVVEEFTDRLGMPIDSGIFETVVVFNLLEFCTFQSCEGHLDHGSPYPWVTVVDTERRRLFTRHWLQVCELEEQAKAAGTTEAYNRYLSADIHLRILRTQWETEDTLIDQLTKLLDTFYADQPEQTSPSRLLLKRFEPGTCRIAPGFSSHVEDLPEHFKAIYLAHGQAEMQAFTHYLKKLWQQSRHQ